MLDDGPTQLIQKRAEEHAKHGFYLNLDESLAYQDYNQRIINTLEMMLANGLKLNTRRQVCNTLRQLNRHVDLMNPEAVKTCIATMTRKNKDGTIESISDASKQKKVNNYDYFVKQNGLLWKKPFYTYDSKVPMTPTETQANEIISAAPTLNMAAVFRILLESGFEGQELNNTIEADIDTEQGIITVAGTKQHNGRAYKFSPSVQEMLKLYMATHHRTHPFPTPAIMGKAWRTARERASSKTGKKELLKQPLKGLRNLSGIIVYRNCKDPWTVMFHMGHKKLDTTQHYLRAMKPYYTNAEEKGWISKCASTPKEAMELINAGFTEASVWGEKHIFKKKIDI